MRKPKKETPVGKRRPVKDGPKNMIVADSEAVPVDLADLISIRAAAEMLALHVGTIYNMQSAGTLTRYRFGSRTYASRKELAGMIQAEPAPSASR